MLKPFFCYYGGKWRAALTYPRPVHEWIVEPFAGGAGYATRYHDKSVVLVERDPKIAAVWRYLIGASRSEIQALPLTIENTVEDLDVSQSAKYLIGFWLNKGAAQPMLSPSAWMRSGTRPNSYWGAAIRERIANQVEAIKHWSIIEGDYSEAPDISATWFVDPPYEQAGKHYKFNRIDYQALATWCRSRSGQIMVCEQDGAQWMDFEAHASIRSNPSKNGKGTSAEAICAFNK